MKLKRLAIQTAIICFLMSLFVPFAFADSGYATGFEGPKPTFYGVAYAPSGTTTLYYTDSTWYSASLHRFDTVFKFDADQSNGGKPDIIGEETSVFIPEETLSNYADWVPSDWLDDHEYVNNPVQVYEWNISDETYYMEQWLLRYYVTFGCEYSFYENPRNIVGTNLNVYNNLETWIRFNSEPTWYIQGGGTAYFAIGKVQLAHNAKYGAVDVDGNTVDTRNEVSVSPESSNSIVYLYYSPFGGESAQTDAYDYLGHKLNPAIFRDNVYFHIDLNNFGTEAGNTFGFNWWNKGDTVTLAFDVTVFVIGEWKVQDVENDPDIYGRFTRQSYDLEGIINLITGVLSSPYGWVIIAIVIFFVILIFFPWVIMIFK